jgi:hypothetical protein
MRSHKNRYVCDQAGVSSSCKYCEHSTRHANADNCVNHYRVKCTAGGRNVTSMCLPENFILESISEPKE